MARRSGSAAPSRTRWAATGGIAVHAALQAAERLREAGLSVGVIDMPTIKPLDRDAVLAARAAGRMLTVEEHNVMGGLGSAVAEVLADGGLGVRLRRHGITTNTADRAAHRAVRPLPAGRRRHRRRGARAAGTEIASSTP